MREGDHSDGHDTLFGENSRRVPTTRPASAPGRFRGLAHGDDLEVVSSAVVFSPVYRACPSSRPALSGWVAVPAPRANPMLPHPPAGPDAASGGVGAGRRV